MNAATTGVSSEMKAQIHERLRVIEADCGITILYAVESGSRAYGLHSPDSDYDVRFIFVQPLEAYLGLDDSAKERVIEIMVPGELDIVGWDIFKAMRQMRKYNPQLLEWLHSPIVYLDRMDMHILAGLRDIGKNHSDAPAVFYHYSRMARGNFHQYIENPVARAIDAGEEPKVLLKKYLYVLRPLLALRYIDREGYFPSLRFRDVLAPSVTYDMPVSLRKEILDLVNTKQSSEEFGLGAPLAALNQWIRDELAYHETRASTYVRDYMREHPRIADGNEFAWLEWALHLILTRQSPRQLLELQERRPGALHALKPVQATDAE